MISIFVRSDRPLNIWTLKKVNNCNFLNYNDAKSKRKAHKTESCESSEGDASSSPVLHNLAVYLTKNACQIRLIGVKARVEIYHNRNLLIRFRNKKAFQKLAKGHR